MEEKEKNKREYFSYFLLKTKGPKKSANNRAIFEGANSGFLGFNYSIAIRNTTNIVLRAVILPDFDNF